MFLWWPCTKIVQAVMICQKTWPQGQGLFSLYIYNENFKTLLVRNLWTNFSIIWQKCSFDDPVPRLFKPWWFVKKHSHQGMELIFPIYLYRKLNLLVRDYYTDFNIIWQKRSFGDPVLRLFRPWWFIRKHGHRRGRGVEVGGGAGHIFSM